MNTKLNLAKRCAIALCALFTVTGAFAQDPSFTGTYPSANPLLRTGNNSSNMIITPYYGSNLQKEGYLLASNVNENGFSVKLTALGHNGILKWSKVYKGSGSATQGTSRCFALTHNTLDNGYLLTGYQSNPDNLRDELWLLRIDENGNIIMDCSFAADSIPCHYTSGPFAALCRSFAAPSFYGLDIIQVHADPDSTQNGDFVVTGFLSEDRAVNNDSTLKRSFIWRFSFIPGSGLPSTRYLKVFHAINAGNYNPSSEELSTDVEEMPDYGLMLLGHMKNNGRIVSPGTSYYPRRPYYAMMRYDGGGSAIAHSSVFSYAFRSNPTVKYVRSLLGKDNNIYLLGYSYPKHAFTITPVKPLSGGNGNTNVYYAPNVADLPAFSMYQGMNSAELVIMGYRLGINEPVFTDYVHPYTIKIGKDGTILSKFNLESVASDHYAGYAPADPVNGVDYFRPFTNKAFPVASVPNIGLLNHHLGFNDAVVAGVLTSTDIPNVQRFNATAHGFTSITGNAACQPYQLSPVKESLTLTYNPVEFVINNITFNTERYLPLRRNENDYSLCNQITEERPAGATGLSTASGQDNGIRVYPNPVSDMLHLEAAATGKYTFTICTATGVQVYSGNFSGSTTVPVQTWANGLYLIRLTKDDGAQSLYKFLKR